MHQVIQVSAAGAALFRHVQAALCGWLCHSAGSCKMLAHHVLQVPLMCGFCFMYQVEARFKILWADHGDDISKQYAGTGEFCHPVTLHGHILPFPMRSHSCFAGALQPTA